MSDTKPIQVPEIGPERRKSMDLAMLAIGWLVGICLAVLAGRALSRYLPL
jgi:hypothetical protein